MLKEPGCWEMSNKRCSFATAAITSSPLVGGEVPGAPHHQPSGAPHHRPSGADVLRVLTSSTCRGFGTCQTASRTLLRILSIVFEELKVLDGVEGLSSYCSVLLGCFPFSLYFSFL